MKEAAQNRAREELVRQQRAAQLAEKMFHKVDRLLDVEFVEQVEIDGRLVLRAVSVNQLIPIAHFMKEFARISVLAVQDKIEEHNARVRKEPERTGPEAGEIIAGVFGFGGRMWGGEPMPELPQDVPAPLVAADQPRQLLPPAFGNANHSAVPTFDAMMEATRGLYDREPEEE